MPKIGDEIQPRGQSTAKVQLEDENYNGRIDKIAFFHEDAKGNRLSQPLPGTSKKVRVYVKLDDLVIEGDGSPIVLSRKFGATLERSDGTPTLFALALQAITGIPAGDPRQRDVDTDTLLGAPIRITTAYNAQKGYTNIVGFLRASRESRGAASAVRNGASASARQGGGSVHGRGEHRPSGAEIFGDSDLADEDFEPR